jgi:hypothetical protein
MRLGVELDGLVQRCLLSGGQWTISAGGKIAQAHGTIGEPGQAVDLKPQCFAPPADDPVAAFIEG